MTPVEVHVDGTRSVVFARYARDKVFQSEMEHDAEYVEPGIMIKCQEALIVDNPVIGSVPSSPSIICQK